MNRALTLLDGHRRLTLALAFALLLLIAAAGMVLMARHGGPASATHFWGSPVKPAAVASGPLTHFWG